jgi:putative cofactor-binding repeat protein
MSTLRSSGCAKYARSAFGRLASLASLAGVAFTLAAPVANAQQCVSFVSGANNSTALTSAIAALPANGGCISFAGGRYVFPTAVTVSYPGSGIYSLSLVGAGSDNTTLYFAASNGITINAKNALQTVHVRDLTFTTGSAGGYSALTLNNAAPLGTILLSDVFRTTFRGDDGGALTDYWGSGVSIVGQSNVNFDSDMFFGPSGGASGVGIELNGNTSVSPHYGIVYNIAKCGFFWEGDGIEIGTYIQGISVTESNFTNGATGIWAQPGGTGLNELAVTGGNQFNTTANQISIQQALGILIVTGNLFYVPSGNSGIYLDSTGQLDTIVNNVFVGPSSPSFGIYVAASNPTSVVTGNVFYKLDVGLDLTGTSGWNVQANTYSGVTTPVANIGSNSVGVATK